uniref:Alpha-macroglobulin receptor-binding domain-containing protein n=1 Tax=Chelydra serpentina TaxID=8475 RepID=A0A8C3T8U2_CHESE
SSGVVRRGLSNILLLSFYRWQLEGHNHIHRTELSTNHVLLYMEQVSNVTQSFSFSVEQDFPVQSLKPALVKVYDYYETATAHAGSRANPIPFSSCFQPKRPCRHHP